MFSKREAISFGWKTTKQNFWFFVSVLLVIGLVSFIPDFATKFFGAKGMELRIINFLVFAMGIVLELGLIKICLKFYDKDKPKFDDLFSQYPLFFRMLFGSILYGLIIVFGMALLIVPGIIFAIRLNFFEYLIVDKGLGPIAALKQSFQITKGAFWNLLLFYLLLIGFNFLGFSFIIVGLFFTVPASMLAMAFVYRKLLT